MDDQIENKNNDSQASVLLNLEQLIKNHISSIDKTSEELKKQKGMLDDIFANDSTYKQHSEQAREAAKIKAATKAQIMKQPQVTELSEKVKNMRQEVKEMQGALSDYLKEYQRMSGVNEIEGEDGEVREIVYTAKLVKRNSNFRP
ncbi:MAG: hypothetical protein Q7S44_01085 [bacterium]|nr:hypothetical protein [bacterium]